MAKITDFYEIPRGEIYFGAYEPGTTIAREFDWVGNAPAVSLSPVKEVQDHYAAYDRDRNKDFSVETMINLTGSMTTDTISPANLAKFFGNGDFSTITQAAVTGVEETFTVSKAGAFLQLGVSATNPTGYRNVANLVLVKDVSGTPTPLVPFADYKIDPDSGMIELMESGIVEAGDVLSATHDVEASTFKRVITKTDSFRGAFKFVTKNKTGLQKDWFAPCAVIRPTGDFNLVTENEFSELAFEISFEKLIGMELMYVDNRVFTG